MHEHTLTCCCGTVDGRKFATSVHAHPLHPCSHSCTPCPKGSMLCCQERSRGWGMRIRKIMQRRLLQARANIGFWGKGLRHIHCTRVAHTMLHPSLPHGCCCELSSVNRREFLYLCDVCVLRLKCQTKFLCSVGVVVPVVGVPAMPPTPRMTPDEAQLQGVG